MWASGSHTWRRSILTKGCHCFAHLPCRELVCFASRWTWHMSFTKETYQDFHICSNHDNAKTYVSNGVKDTCEFHKLKKSRSGKACFVPRVTAKYLRQHRSTCEALGSSALLAVAIQGVLNLRVRSHKNSSLGYTLRLTDGMGWDGWENIVKYQKWSRSTCESTWNHTKEIVFMRHALPTQLAVNMRPMCILGIDTTDRLLPRMW